MTDIGKCPAFGYDCEYVAKVEAQAAEIERLREALAATVDIWNRSKYSGDFEYWLTGHVRAALGGTE